MRSTTWNQIPWPRKQIPSGHTQGKGVSCIGITASEEILDYAPFLFCMRLKLGVFKVRAMFWCIMLVPHALLCHWLQLHPSNQPCCQVLWSCVITKICEWIADVANWKRHQRLDEILIIFTRTIQEISKVVCKKTMSEMCALLTSLCCMKHYSKRMLHKQDCVKFHGHIAWQFFLKQLCWFLQCSAGKKNQEFVQPLVAFPISNISYWPPPSLQIFWHTHTTP